MRSEKRGENGELKTFSAILLSDQRERILFSPIQSYNRLRLDKYQSSENPKHLIRTICLRIESKRYKYHYREGEQRRASV